MNEQLTQEQIEVLWSEHYEKIIKTYFLLTSEC